MALLTVGLAWASASILMAPLAAASVPAPDRPAADDLPIIKELPDLFLFSDGSRVKTREDWARRREELKGLILYYEYGRLPPAPANLAAQELSSKPREALGVTEKQVQLAMGPEGAVKFKLIVSIPTGKTGRMPAIIKDDLCWGRVPDGVIRDAASRGYILVEFDRTEVAPDAKGRTAAIYTAYPDCDGGAQAMWAWGFHRAVDYLLTQDFVDPARIAVTGHSRGGKAALLAGALDERIALVAPNASGAGGASAYRVLHPKGESLKAVTTNFPFWFGPRFPAFQGKETRLPFDQHALRALVAPRAMLSTEGTGDLWANASGNQQAHLAAKQVFDFLGAPNSLGIHYRPGTHDQGAEDWAALLDFADKQFFGKSVTRKFDALPEPDAPKAFSWSAPPPAK